MTLQKETALALNLVVAIIGILAFAANLTQITFVYCKKIKLDQFYITLNALAIVNMIVTALDCAYSFFISFGNFDAVIDDVYGNYYHLAWYFYIFAMLSSTFHIAFIAVQRLLAVYKPIKFRQNFTRKICYIILIAQYFANFSITVAAYFVDKKSGIDIGTVVLCFLMFIFGCLLGPMYLLIWHKTTKRPLSGSNSAQSRLVLKHGILVSSTHILCVLPYCIHELLISLPPYMSIPKLITKIAYILFSFKFLLDPAIYFFVGICRKNKRITFEKRTDDREAQPGTTSNSKSLLQAKNCCEENIAMSQRSKDNYFSPHVFTKTTEGQNC